MKIHFSYGRRTKITENPQVLPILHTSAYVVRCVVSRLTNRYNCSDNYLVPYSCCKIFERESVCVREREKGKNVERKKKGKKRKEEEEK